VRLANLDKDQKTTCKINKDRNGLV